VLLLYGSVRVPNEAAYGRAIITLSVPDYRGSHVVPATFEVPIAEPRQSTNP